MSVAKIKLLNTNYSDAANIGFVIQQVSHLEREVMLRRYPEVTYARDIPVDTSAHPFAKTVTFISQDYVGNAKLISGQGDDLPLVNIDRNKHEAPVFMGGASYRITLEELGQAEMLQMNLDLEEMNAARFAVEKFIDGAAFLGAGIPGGTGLYNSTAVTPIAATGLWSGLTPDQVLGDINTLLGGGFAATLGVEIPDQLRLPLAVFASLSARRVTDTNVTILEFVRANNLYTAATGQLLTILPDHRLPAGRAVAYRRDPSAIRLHIPMPLRFLQPEWRGIAYYVHGVFRMAGIDIRRPGAVRYMDGVAS